MGVQQLANPTRILIIAPLATALGWQREWARWWPDCPLAFTICRRKDPLPATGVVFIAWTDLAVRLPELLTRRFDVCIADEAHRAKGGTGVKMSKAFTGAWRKGPTGQWVREEGVADRAGRIWVLTGTPMPNSRPIELLPILSVLGVVGNRGALMTRKDYETQFCEQRNPWSPSGVDLMARRNIDDLADLMRRSGAILRRTAADVRGELPALTRQIIPLGGITESSLASDEARAFVSRGELPPLEEMSAYRRDLGRAKAPAAAAWIASMLEDIDAIVVFVHHKAVGQTIRDMLAQDDDLGAIEFASGDDSPEERQAKVDRFADAKGPRVFIGTIDACGTGMNGLHRRTTVCCFVECEWTPATLDQAEGRIRRMGGAGGADAHAVAYYLGAADCLDIHIIETVNDKRDVIWQALDADEGARATAAPNLPPPPPDMVTPEALSVDQLPEPTEVHWSWAKDKQTGEWLLRNGHFLDDSAKAAWTGAEITVRTASGKEQVRRLVACRYTGPHNGGWCIWTHSDPVSAAGKNRDANARFVARMKRRAHDAELLSSLDAGGVLDDADRSAAVACHAAAGALTAMDPDRAFQRNREGWSAADGTVGRILAGVDPAFWTKATLAGARTILWRYRNTQIPANLSACIWPA